MKRYSMYPISEKEIKQWLKEDGITLGEYDIDADKGAVYIDVDINTVPDEYKYIDELDYEAFLGKHIIGRMCTNKYNPKRYPEKYAGRPLAWVFAQDGDQDLPNEDNAWFYFVVEEQCGDFPLHVSF